MGNWEDFLLDEMIPRIEADFRVRRGPVHRAVFGKSSGGYGSIVQGLRHGDRWGAVACHSGDIGFENVYRREFLPLLNVLAGHDGKIPRFIEHLRSSEKMSSKEMHALMMLAMAATYDPDPKAPFGIRLPVDPRTAELDAERWSRWLEHDPLALVEQPDCQDSLRALKGLFVDCGGKDQYFVQYGTRAFAARLEALGIPHRFEEFDDDHTGVDYRMDRSLPFLYEAIATG